jgi:hypothetical protein
LGLAGLVIPARASLSFYTGTEPATSAISSFDTSAAGLSLSALSTFASGNLSGTPDIYIDPATGAEFFGFAFTSGSNGAADSLGVWSTVLDQNNSGGIIEITLPANTFAFAADIGTISGLGGYCVGVNEPGFNTGSECDESFSAGGSNTAFIGLVDTVPITNIWIGPLTTGAYSSETTKILDFEIGTEGSTTPDAPTLVTMGGGLMLLGALRWRRRRGAVPLQ